MFENERQQLNHQVALDALREESGHKVTLIQQYIYEFGRINKSQTKPQKQTSEIVKLSRKVIQEGERILVIIEEYLQELGMGFLHQLVWHLYKALVVCFHSLSSNFTTLFLQKKIHSPDDALDDVPIGKRQFKRSRKQLQYLDSAIRDLEEQQMKIQEKKKMVQSEMLLQNKAYMKITPSDTAHQLQNINNHLLQIIVNSDKIAGENVLYRYQDLRRNILTIKKPEQIQEEFCHHFSNDIRSKFVKSMQKLQKDTSILARNQQRQVVLEELSKSKVPKVSTFSQTDFESKNRTRQIDHLNKEKKILTAQNEGLKKMVEEMKKQVNTLQTQLKLQQSHNSSLTKKLDSFEDELVAKMNEIDLIQKQNEDLKKRMIASQAQLSSIRATPRRKSEEMNSSKCKSLRASNKSTLENQIKLKDSEIENLRTNLELIVKTMQQLEFIDSQIVEQLLDIAEQEQSQQKIKQISEKVSNKVSSLREQIKELKEQNQKLIKIQNKEVQKIDAFTETQQKSETVNTYCQTDRLLSEDESVKSNKLQDLKKDFIQRLTHNKKHHEGGKKHKKFIFNEKKYNEKEEYDDSMRDFVVEEHITSTSRPKGRNSKLAISFEEFNFSNKQKKLGQLIEKRGTSKVIKKMDTQESEISDTSYTQRGTLNKIPSIRSKANINTENLSHFAKAMR